MNRISGYLYSTTNSVSLNLLFRYNRNFRLKTLGANNSKAHENNRTRIAWEKYCSFDKQNLVHVFLHPKRKSSERMINNKNKNQTIDSLRNHRCDMQHTFEWNECDHISTLIYSKNNKRMLLLQCQQNMLISNSSLVFPKLYRIHMFYKHLRSSSSRW